jgi:hypothetical protein
MNLFQETTALRKYLGRKINDKQLSAKMTKSEMDRVTWSGRIIDSRAYEEEEKEKAGRGRGKGRGRERLR